MHVSFKFEVQQSMAWLIGNMDAGGIFPRSCDLRKRNIILVPSLHAPEYVTTQLIFKH